MHCKACNFIIKGYEGKCPYCGTIFEESKFLDRKINFMGWLYITYRQLIIILLVNLFFISVLTDILTYNLGGIELHLTPWVSLGLAGIYFILSTYISPINKKNRFSFIKINIILICFSILLWGSYFNDNLFGLNMDFVQILFGYFYPIMVSSLILLGLIRYVFFRYINMFSSLFYIIYSLVISLVSFGLSFIPNLSLYYDSTAKLIIYISCVFNLFLLINTIIIMKMRMSSNIIKEA